MTLNPGDRFGDYAVVQVCGRECYRATLNDAVQWEDFERGSR